MDRVLCAVFADEKCTDELRSAYYLLSKETVNPEDKTTQSILKNVKSLLLSSKTRCQGLIFLSNVLGQLSNDNFIDNCPVLVQPAIKVLQESRNFDERILAYKVLTQIFAQIYRLDSQNLTRELSNCVAPLLTHCFANPLTLPDIYYASNWLSACATVFPSPVSAKRVFLESKILEAVSSIVDEDGDPNALKALGFAYAKVMLSGNSNVSKFREFFSKLMNTFGQYFNLYNNVFLIKSPSPILKFENDQCIANFFKVDGDIFIDPLKNARRIQFLAAAICALITGQFVYSTPLPVECILEYLNIFTLVSNGNIKDGHSIDVFAVGYVIPILYDNIFTILRALLISCKHNMIPFTRLVNRIVISTLEWLDKLDSIENRLYLNLRGSVYTFMSLYFNTLGTKACFSTAEHQLLVKHLLGNVKIIEPNITFTSKAQKTFGSNQSNSKRELLLNSTLRSIQVISCLISSMGSSLDPSIFNLIQSEVIHTLLNIYRNWFNLLFPYKNEDCRRELIELLKLVLQNAPTAISHSQGFETAIALLTQAYRIDKSPAVRYQIENCYHLANFILSSRLPTSVPVMGINESSSSTMNNQLPPYANSIQLIQQSVFSTLTGSNDNIELVKLSKLESSSAVESGTKRRNSSEIDCSTKMAREEELNTNSDIIFEGIFTRTCPQPPISVSSSEAQFINNATVPKGVVATDANAPTQLTTIIEPAYPEPRTSTRETSTEANDALSYFVVE